MSSCKTTVETWFRRVWNEEDESAIEELFVPDGEARGLGANALVGPRDFKLFHSALRALLTNFNITIDKAIEEGDWIALICTLNATSRQSGEPVVITGSVMIRVENCQIMEAYNHWDFLTLFGQLDLLPASTFQQALAGNKVA